MSEKDTTTCPACGEESRDPQWCDTCGTRLDGDADPATEWLEVGQTCHVLDSSERRLVVDVTDAVDTFATRRVLFGTVKDGDDDLVGQRVLIEERDAGQPDVETRIPDELSGLFRTPLGVGKHGAHSVRCYRDTGAVTLEDLVELSGRLNYAQVKDVFLAILDAVAAAHQHEHLILAIAPWTLRLDNVRVPDSEGDETHINPERGAAAIKAPPNDDTPPMVLDEPTREMSALEVLDAVKEPHVEEETREMEALERPADASSDGEQESANGDDFSRDDTRVDQDALDAFDDEEYVAAPLSEAHDIDELWDALDDSEVLTSTSQLHLSALGQTDVEAYFEGVDELFPFEGEPYEVPVIMGFSPPELLGRVRADLGPYCDVFALGMLLYFMIAGRVPPASVYTRYTPALPVRNFRPDFPPGLQPVIGRATRPNPTHRYPTVQALREAFVDACALMEQRAHSLLTNDPPRVAAAVDTHVGIAKGRRNPTNQDSVFGKSSDDGLFAMIVVADGVSTASYGSGDLASRSLTTAAKAVWADVLPKYLMDERVEEVSVIQEILTTANDMIVEHVNEHHTPFEGNPHEVMGSTALIAVIRDGLVTLAALGDSRVYIQTLTGLEQVTADHNLWTLSVIEGISADAALSMPHGDALARCLGTFAVEKGQLRAITPEADFFRFALARGDRMLMTTDGLTDFAGSNSFAAEENILATMLAEPDPALACLELILLANRGGGGDNVGVGVVNFV